MLVTYRRAIKTRDESNGLLFFLPKHLRKHHAEKYASKNRLLRIQLLIHLIQRRKRILTQKRDCSFQTLLLF